MERRKIASEAEARRALQAVKAARVSIGAWARAHGIDGRSLHAWDIVLERKGRRGVGGRPKTAAGLVELVPMRTGVSQARYVLKVGDITVEFGDDAHEDTLRRTVRVLRSC